LLTINWNSKEVYYNLGAGLQKSLQAEWQFLQQVTDGLGNEFLEIEKTLSQEFLPALFGVDSVNETHKLLACLPVKAGELVIPNPTATAEQNWTVLTLICGHLVAALRGREEFHLADHTAIMAFGKAEVRQRRKTAELEASLDAILQGLEAAKSRTIRRGMETGAWLSILPLTVNGMDLSA
jgi:hypothetical protein